MLLQDARSWWSTTAACGSRCFAWRAALGLQTKGPEDNWIAPSDLSNLLALARFELVTSQARVLVPVWIPILSDVVNRWLAPLPGFRMFAMLHVAVGSAAQAGVDAKPHPFR